jgi:chromosome segregation ATPase
MDFIRGRSLSDSGKRQLQTIADRKRQVAELDSQINGIESEINDTTRDQDRMRQNISSLNSVSGQQEQVQRYARQLSDGEGRLATLRDQQRDARKKKQSLEREVSTLIDNLEF